VGATKRAAQGQRRRAEDQQERERDDGQLMDGN